MEKENLIKEAKEKHAPNTLGLQFALVEIEQNRGWIKIESKEDLPKECGTYHIVVSGIVYVDEYNSCTKEFSEWFNHAITHYQPIVKPLPPLY